MDGQGKLVMTRGRIAKRYASSWLFPDVVAGVPWEWLNQDGSPVKLARSLRVLRAVRLLRLTRLLRLVKLRKMMEKFDTFIEGSSSLMFLMGVLRVIACLGALTHWAACLWYVVGTSKNTFDTNWVEVYLKKEGRHTPAENYFYSLYFAWMTMTTVGFGDMHPQNYK